MSNALRHTPIDAPLSVGATRQCGGLTIRFADGGPGIEADQVDKLFDRFYRTDAGRGRNRGGSGLGLSIAKAIIEAHQGTVVIDSVVGTGTTVTINLPATAKSTCGESYA